MANERPVRRGESAESVPTGPDSPRLSLIQRIRTQAPSSMKLLVFAAAYLSVIVLGARLGGWVGDLLEFDIYLSPSTESAIHRMVLLAFAAYVALMMLPFVPGIEIGLGLMVVFGGEICLLVYIGTVLALTVSFLIGALVPEGALRWVLGRLHLRRAEALVTTLEKLPLEERLSRLLESSSSRGLPWLLKYRYLAVAVALNVPGNALVGGGGGIGLAAGMSRLFRPLDYLLTVVVAVAPVPVAVVLTETIGR
jgi:hypothetical protein